MCVVLSRAIWTTIFVGFVYTLPLFTLPFFLVFRIYRSAPVSSFAFFSIILLGFFFTILFLFRSTFFLCVSALSLCPCLVLYVLPVRLLFLCSESVSYSARALIATVTYIVQGAKTKKNFFAIAFPSTRCFTVSSWSNVLWLLRSNDLQVLCICCATKDWHSFLRGATDVRLCDDLSRFVRTTIYRQPLVESIVVCSAIFGDSFVHRPTDTRSYKNVSTSFRLHIALDRLAKTTWYCMVISLISTAT